MVPSHNATYPLLIIAVLMVCNSARAGEISDYKTSGDRRIGEINKKLVKSPKDTSLYIARARLHAEMCQDDKAIEDCTIVLKLKPGHADALKMRAAMFAAGNKQ